MSSMPTLKLATYNHDMVCALLSGKMTYEGLTAAEMASQVGVSASTMTRIFQGKMPSVETLAMISNWLNVSVESFFCDIERAVADLSTDKVSRKDFFAGQALQGLLAAKEKEGLYDMTSDRMEDLVELVEHIALKMVQFEG